MDARAPRIESVYNPHKIHIESFYNPYMSGEGCPPSTNHGLVGMFHMGDGVRGHPFNTAILRYLGNMRMVHHLMVVELLSPFFWGWMAVRDSAVE